MRLEVASGGVVFTTIQKFFPDEKGGKHPLLSDWRNIVVIADEAHRSQYDFIDGFAKHIRDALPKASFIGFTGNGPGARARRSRSPASTQARRAVNGQPAESQNPTGSNQIKPE
jgi:type I restriction enzyme R subunit